MVDVINTQIISKIKNPADGKDLQGTALKFVKAIKNIGEKTRFLENNNTFSDIMENISLSNSSSSNAAATDAAATDAPEATDTAATDAPDAPPAVAPSDISSHHELDIIKKAIKSEEKTKKDNFTDNTKELQNIKFQINSATMKDQLEDFINLSIMTEKQ